MELYFHSLTNLTEARFAASVYPKYIGFCFDEESPFYLSPLAFSKISPWLSGTEIVAQFGYTPARSILETAHLMGVLHVELPVDHPELSLVASELSVVLVGASPQSSLACRVPCPSEQNIPLLPHVFYDVDARHTSHLEWVKQMHPIRIALCGMGLESEPGMADVSAWVDLMEELGLL